MSEFQVLEEVPLSLPALKQALKGLQTDGTLPYRAEKTTVYIDSFSLGSFKEAQDLMKKIMDLNIPRLKERHGAKIIDVMPKDLDSLRILLSNETITIKDEDIKRILELLPE